MKDKILTLLSKPFYRGLLLFPPLFLCIMSLGLIWYHIYMNFNFIVPVFFRIVYIIAGICVLIFGSLILWVDNENEKYKYRKRI